jgi:hypothetical protein
VYSDLRRQWSRALEDRGDDCERCGGANRSLEILLDENLDAADIVEALDEEYCLECGRKLVHQIAFEHDAEGNPVDYLLAVQVPLWREPLRPQ